MLIKLLQVVVYYYMIALKLNNFLFFKLCDSFTRKRDPFSEQLSSIFENNENAKIVI